MADIELVIKLDEETYNDIKRGKIYSSYRDVPQESVLAIANGIPLPKGHGDLIDAHELVKGRVSNDPIVILANHAEIIIEADKESEI